MRVLTECSPAPALPRRRQKAQIDCGRAAVEPWAERPRIALCRCLPRCELLMLKWAGGQEEITQQRQNM